jgi:hypothetical protein
MSQHDRAGLGLGPSIRENQQLVHEGEAGRGDALVDDEHGDAGPPAWVLADTTFVTDPAETQARPLRGETRWRR